MKPTSKQLKEFFINKCNNDIVYKEKHFDYAKRVFPLIDKLEKCKAFPYTNKKWSMTSTLILSQIELKLFTDNLSSDDVFDIIYKFLPIAKSKY